MITRVTYYLIIKPISLLPYPILYLISDVLYIIIYKIFGYRKKVVETNLNKSFPEKKHKEIKEITKKYYRHLCDIIMEGIKGFSISEKELRKRLVIKNPEISNKFADQRKSIILVGGHYNNWEIYAQAFAMYSKHTCIGIYKTLSNSFMNNKLNKSRSRYGMNLISMKNTIRSFEEGDEIKAIIFGADQNPANPKKSYWLNFLNQDTAVLFGTEKYAKKYNWPVIFVNINKTKRGYYEVDLSLITKNPIKEKHGKITEDFTKMLEKNIINQPEYWLWSHKRWKHKKQK